MARRIRLDDWAVPVQNEPMTFGEFTSQGERELTITRMFNAPRRIVWAAWTNPEHAIKWWGPRDYPATHMEMDVREGGKWRMCLTGTGDGRALWQHGEFQEIDEPELLVFTFVWEEEGERGVESVVTIEFEDRGDKTLMRFRQGPFQSLGERDGHGGGWSSTFDRLEDFLRT